MKITTAHGGGGKLMEELIGSVFLRHFSNDTLNALEDAALLDAPAKKLAFTTDSFVVTPLFFPGGDIGRLAVCGTVNDLLCRGATPKYLSAGFILEEGLDLETLERAVRSMKAAADEAGVAIVTGDTKVIEGKGGLYINTAGIGFVEEGVNVSAKNLAPGDVILVSGHMGNHHAAILSSRMHIQNHIASDCAPLNDMVKNLLSVGVRVHALRDITRGGLATVLNELAQSSGVCVELSPVYAPADLQVQGFCDILGLDPLYMGNEGKLCVAVHGADAQKALEILRASRYGENASIAGTVREGSPTVLLKTRSGATRAIDALSGEGLPRIC
ncbi:MAG: hydrogenase expression/formation protein HypE [Clostridiaceae bacterium]|nr:hydrogenase expression/formation protein HypE [Eubacteriales bacterium]